MITVRCLTLVAMSLLVTNAAMRSGTNLPAAHAVSVESPSVSTIPSQVGTLLPSISLETMK